MQIKKTKKTTRINILQKSTIHLRHLKLGEQKQEEKSAQKNSDSHAWPVKGTSSILIPSRLQLFPND